MQQFFLDTDDDGHWYVVPVDLRDVWEAFNEDPEAFDFCVPEGVEEIGGAPNNVTFTDPVNSLA